MFDFIIDTSSSIFWNLLLSLSAVAIYTGLMSFLITPPSVKEEDRPKDITFTEKYKKAEKTFNAAQKKIRDTIVKEDMLQSASVYVETSAYISFGAMYIMFVLIISFFVIYPLWNIINSVIVGGIFSDKSLGILDVHRDILRLIPGLFYVTPRNVSTLRLFRRDYSKGDSLRHLSAQFSFIDDRNQKIVATECGSCNSFYAKKEWLDNKRVTSVTPKRSRRVEKKSEYDMKRKQTRYFNVIIESSWDQVEYLIDEHVGCNVCSYHTVKT